MILIDVRVDVAPEALDAIHLGRVRRQEVQDEAGRRREIPPHADTQVDPVVVEDQMSPSGGDMHAAKFRQQGPKMAAALGVPGQP